MRKHVGVSAMEKYARAMDGQCILVAVISLKTHAEGVGINVVCWECQFRREVRLLEGGDDRLLVT